MKADRIILFLVVVIMLASVAGSYFLFLQQDALSGKKIELIKADVDKLKVSFREINSKFEEEMLAQKAGIDFIKKMEERIDAADVDRKELASKVSDLIKSVNELKGIPVPAEPVAQVVAQEAPVAQPETATTPGSVVKTEDKEANVDLGQIPVQK